MGRKNLKIDGDNGKNKKQKIFRDFDNLINKKCRTSKLQNILAKFNQKSMIQNLNNIFSILKVFQMELG